MKRLLGAFGLAALAEKLKGLIRENISAGEELALGRGLRAGRRVRGAARSEDERSGKELGDGAEFNVEWGMNQAVILSFEGAPPV